LSRKQSLRSPGGLCSMIGDRDETYLGENIDPL
jgi:hypothetical protein